MKTVQLDFEDGIAWVAMSRPDKKNAISVEMAGEMVQVMDQLETDSRCQVLVLTGAGESFSAGMDLKDYFRATDNKSAVERARVYRLNAACSGAGCCITEADRRDGERLVLRRRVHSAVACDLAIAADEATFGLSEINWGIIPAGVVCRRSPRS